MTPFELYKLYTAIHLHFTSDTYDCVKYNFKTGVSEQSFQKRKDRNRFVFWARKIEKKDLFDFLVGNLIIDGNTWIGAFREEHMLAYRKRMQSLHYTFRSEISKLIIESQQQGIQSIDDWFCKSTTSHPFILLMFLQGELSRETFLLLGKVCTDGFDTLDKELDGDVVWEDTKFHCEKYWKLIEPKIGSNTERFEKSFKELLATEGYKEV